MGLFLGGQMLVRGAASKPPSTGSPPPCHLQRKASFQPVRPGRRLGLTAVSGQPWENFQLNHLVLAFLVAARFADAIVSRPPYQFAMEGRFDRLLTGFHSLYTVAACHPTNQSTHPKPVP
jgi:hypothetical protein